MTKRLNMTLAYDVESQTYETLPSPPERPAYSQGACDGENLYVVGGRSSKRNVYRLSRDETGNWMWSSLPPLPPGDEAGRWLGSVGIVPGKWLLLVGGICGFPPGVGSAAGGPKAPDWRLRLDKPDAQWEPMAEYPAGSKHLTIGAMAGGKFYVFGGTPGMVVNRHAFCYDPETDTWSAIKELPLPRSGGSSVVLDDRYILLMGSGRTDSIRYGGAAGGWTGYSDEILGYDIVKDNYFRVGNLLYGIATSPWVQVGDRVYSFGGEPQHNINENTENVLQIGTLKYASE
jgi:N-acetylneuraminic acid mutarotase